MKKFVIVFLILISLFLIGCTQNQFAKKYGGSVSINLEENKKMINVTWKDNNLWFLTRVMKENEKPECYELIEDSNFGVLEGKITICEKKTGE